MSVIWARGGASPDVKVSAAQPSSPGACLEPEQPLWPQSVVHVGHQPGLAADPLPQVFHTPCDDGRQPCAGTTLGSQHSALQPTAMQIGGHRFPARLQSGTSTLLSDEMDGRNPRAADSLSQGSAAFACRCVSTLCYCTPLIGSSPSLVRALPVALSAASDCFWAHSLACCCSVMLDVMYSSQHAQPPLTAWGRWPKSSAARRRTA